MGDSERRRFPERDLQEFLICSNRKRFIMGEEWIHLIRDVVMFILGYFLKEPIKKIAYKIRPKDRRKK